ncbi:MAG: aminotransferase class IV [Phycisphaerae bacterium]|nr:aminotransferase class IV [Phycisphaerae bacterium]
MSEVVWVNGKFVTRDEARVSAFDAGLLHAVGLFETMLATPIEGDEDATRGRVFRVHRHMERLERSARTLGLTDGLKVRALQELIEHVVERSELTRGAGAAARVRLTVTGGDLNLLSSRSEQPPDPTVMISVQPATRNPPEMFERGVRIAVASARANPLGADEGHKTLNYWWRLRELRAASLKGCAEALVLQVTNYLCGGTVSNLFALRGGSLITPTARGEEERLGGEDLPSPVLPGITREAVIEAAASIGVGCSKRAMTIADVLDADEVFLTNSSWGVLPVTAVEAKSIGAGGVGEFTARLRNKWLEMLRSEA